MRSCIFRNRYLGKGASQLAIIEKTGTVIVMKHNAAGELPEFLHGYFQEYEPSVISLEKHAGLVTGRIMERGTWRAMLWLRRTFSDAELRDYLQTRGRKILPARELNYWALICGIPEKTRNDWLREIKCRKDTWSRRHVP